MDIEPVRDPEPAVVRRSLTASTHNGAPAGPVVQYKLEVARHIAGELRRGGRTEESRWRSATSERS